MLYCIVSNSPAVNQHDVIGWNIQTGEAGIWSGLFGNRAFFPLRSEAKKFIRILENNGIDTKDLAIERID